MSRRRQKNPLLGRILLISIGAHLVILPVLAYFGAFKKIQQNLMPREVTIVPPPPEKDKPVAPKEEPKKVAAPEKKEGAPKGAKSQPVTNQPKVAAAASAPGAGDTGGPSVNPQGTGKAGEVPKPATGNGGTGTGAGSGEGAKPPVTTPAAKPETPQPRLESKPEPTPEPAKPVEKKAPVLVAAEPLDQPSPEIPDDLRAEAMDHTVVVLIAVSPSGSAQDVSVVNSSGVSELDDIAVRAARRWKFRPATRDGEPVVGKVRLHVRFKVD